VASVRLVLARGTDGRVPALRRRTKDGKSYVQLIIPRRRTPHPCSLGGLVHMCFFAAEDPFDSDQCVNQVAAKDHSRTTQLLAHAMLARVRAPV
jgi:hypothetical protein